MLHLVCVHPEIPQNTGTLIRTAACLQFELHLVEPLGFLMRNKHLERSHMDYKDHAHLTLHSSFQAFYTSAKTRKRRLIALEARGHQPFYDFSFQPNDMLILGSESKGFSSEHLAQMDAQITLPMATKRRSLNMAIAGSIAISHALLQLNLWPAASSSNL